jgi:hypothetical protein
MLRWHPEWRFADLNLGRSDRSLLAASLLAALAPFATVAASADEADVDNSGGSQYRVDPGWPQLPLPGKWLLGDVAGVNIDRHGNIWIVNRPGGLRPVDVQADDNPPTAKCCVAAPPVIELDVDGKVLRSWGGPAQVENWFNSEHAIYPDDEDNIWIVGAGAGDGQLMKFTMDGELLLRIGRKGPAAKGDDPTMLGLPTDIYVDSKRQEVYVSDGYGNHRVIVFDSNTGAFKRQWTAFGNEVDPEYVSGPEEIGSQGEHDVHEIFTTVHCVTMIGDEVHVCDRTNKRIQAFKPDGTFLREIWFNKDLAGGAGSTWDAAPVPGHPDQILVVDGVNSEFAVLNRFTGEVVSSYLSKGRYNGQMHWPHQVAMDSEGRVYVAEVGGSARFQRFVPVAQPDR